MTRSLLALALLLAACSRDADGDGYRTPDDCDDTLASVHPGAVEVCNGLDDDCDGLADPPDAPGGSTWYRDVDGDGHAGSTSSSVACSAPADHYEDPTDCDDDDPAVHPDTAETCATAHDDDCDGQANEVDAEGCTTRYLDADGDGYGSADSRCTCEPVGDHTALVGGDCDDGEAAVHPDRDEDCATAADDDCSGTDNDVGATGCAWFYADEDADGFGDQDDPGACTCEGTAARPVADATDCDDARELTHPGATEYCNGHDDDCDGITDEDDAVDAPTWYADADADGYGDASSTAAACEAPTGHVGDDTDCDDGDATIHPAATEVCDEADVDEDCDGLADDEDSSADPSTMLTGYPDDDGDGYGDEGDAGAGYCDLPSGVVLDSTDCDDDDDEVHPGATETCNEVDDDCDGDTDPDSSADASTWYPDADADGFGDPDGASSVSCEAPSGTVADATDCDDGDDAVNPAAEELCNEVDDDCDGEVDVGATDASTWYPDDDGDGYGDDDSSTEACDQPSGHLDEAGDCDDADGEIYPGAIEWCGDGVDQDCDGIDTGDTDCAPTGDTSSSTGTLTGTSTYTATEVLAVSDDVDGDGAREVIIGRTSGMSGYGGAYGHTDLADGSSSQTGASFTLRWYGAASGDEFGADLAAFSDADGDGLPELAFGAPGNDDTDTDAGAVYIFSGDGGATSATSITTSYADYAILGAEAGDELGRLVVNPGDLDGDGEDDLVLGGPGAATPDSDSGAVWVAFYDGWASGAVSVDDLSRFSGEREDDALATAAAGGDLDGDGYHDLVLSSADSDEVATDAGAAWVWFGPLDEGDHQVAAAPLRVLGAAASDYAGASLAIADLDADGVEDLAVGAPGTDATYSAEGSVGVLYGPLPWGELSLEDADLTLTGAASSDAVGSWLSTGDLDRDGWGDLALGVPATATLGSTDGGAFVFYGPPGTGTLDLASADAGAYSSTGSTAGAGVLVADLSGDGFDDLLFHADTSSGDLLELFLGGTRVDETASTPDTTTDDDGDGYTEEEGDCDDGRSTRSPGLTEACGEGGDEDCDGYADRCMADDDVAESELEILVDNDVSSSTTHYDLGEAVGVVGDLNGDGAQDVAVVDDLWGSRVGRISVFFGPVPSGSVGSDSADVVIEGVSSGDLFYAELRGVGDLDEDGFPELLVGTLSEVSIFRGGPDLAGTLSLADADWIITDARTGGGDCDLDGDGYADLVLGAPYEDAGGEYDSGTLAVAFGPVSTGSTTLASIGDLVLEGTHDTQYTGMGARCWGDLTGDGSDDLLVVEAGWRMPAVPSGSRRRKGRFLLLEGPLDPTAGTLDPMDAVVAASPEYPAYPKVWTVGDLDGDGLPDLVLSNEEAGWAVVPLAGARGLVEIEEDAIATLSDPTAAFGEGFVELAAGDLDRDGVDDLVVGVPGAVYVVFGPLDGDYNLNYADLTIEADSDASYGSAVDVGDLEQDGFDDILIGMSDYGTSRYKPGAFAVLRGGWTSATGGATSPHLASDDWDEDGVTGAAGDCHDGDADIGPAGTEVCGDLTDEDCDGFALECAPDGERTDYWPVLTLDVQGNREGPEGLVANLGDLDGDGLPDHLMVDDYYDLYVVGSPLPVLGWLDTPDWATATLTPPTTTTWVTVSTLPDVDGDGLVEWVVATTDDAVYVLDTSSGTGSRSLTGGAWIFTETTSGSSWGGRADGGADAFGTYDATLALTDQSGDYGLGNEGAVLAFGVDAATTGTFAAADADLVIVGDSAGDVLGGIMKVLDDLDGDGLVEITASSWNSTSSAQTTYVWTSSDGTGTLAASDCSIALQDTSHHWPGSAFSPGDLDGDGSDDLVMANDYHADSTLGHKGAIWVWSGLPTAGTHSPVSGDLTIIGTTYQEGVGESVAEHFDLDGDGYEDLVFTTSTENDSTTDNGAVQVFYGPLTLSGSVDAVDADGTIWADPDIEDYGQGLVPAGDVDGDGYQDLWVGAEDTLGILLRGGPLP